MELFYINEFIYYNFTCTKIANRLILDIKIDTFYQIAYLFHIIHLL